jgi:hypothetical protein
MLNAARRPRPRRLLGRDISMNCNSIAGLRGSNRLAISPSTSITRRESDAPAGMPYGFSVVVLTVVVVTVVLVEVVVPSGRAELCISRPAFCSAVPVA